MKLKSIKTNYFLNVFRVAFGTLVGLFTMPYVNSVLGAGSLGKVEYVNSIINYFVLFSALGIPMYGNREIARVRDNIHERTNVVIELIIILIITTILSYIVLFGVLLQFEYFENLKYLIIIMSTTIFFTNLGVEWFYYGMEDQKFITIRFTVVRIITLFMLYLFVKSQEDYLYYGAIMVLTTVGSNFFNIIYIFKFLELKEIKLKTLKIKRHIKPVLTIFIATISVNIYLILDNILLGTMVGEESVGYYSVANKLIRFVITFITVLGAVMLPRLSYLVDSNRSEYIRYAKKSFQYIIAIALPFSVIFFFSAEDIVLIMAGDKFIPSILTMKILSPLTFIVGIAYFIGFLVLYPQGKEKKYTIAVSVSAILSVAINLFAIPKFKHDGAATVSVISEIIAILVMVLLSQKELKELKLINKNVRNYIIAAIIMSLVVYCFKYMNSIPIINFSLSSIAGLLTFLVSLFVLKDEIIQDIFAVIKQKLKI